MRGDFGFPFHTEGNRTTQSKTEPFVEETVFVLFVSFCHALQKIGRRIHRLIMNYESTICCTLSRRNSTVFVNSGDRWKCMQWMLTTGVASIHSGMCREITQSSLGSNIHWRRSWICVPCSWNSLCVPTLLIQFFFVSTFELSIPGRSGLRPQCLFLTLLAEMFAGFPRQISKEDYSHTQQRNINATLKKMRFSLPCTGVMTAWISLSGPRNCGS